jgi:hypothetical protein
MASSRSSCPAPGPGVRTANLCPGSSGVKGAVKKLCVLGRVVPYVGSVCAAVRVERLASV